MELPAEIRQAAMELGKHLTQDADVRAYRAALERILRDPEASRLDAQFEQLAEELAKHEQKGETISSSQWDAYFELKFQILRHPLFVMRDASLEGMQELFFQTAQKISIALRIDYPSLAYDD
jgi:cell fate (sporulation/competence/biofilm development) regulator YlbF (YheA/YmcA/DUF963 family)